MRQETQPPRSDCGASVNAQSWFRNASDSLIWHSALRIQTGSATGGRLLCSGNRLTGRIFADRIRQITPPQPGTYPFLLPNSHYST